MKKFFSILGIILLAVLIIVYFSLNSIAKSAINTFGPDLLKVPVSVESVRISPFSGEGSIQGLIVGSPEGYDAEYTFALQDIKVKLFLSTILSDEIIIDSIEINEPHIIYQTKFGGSNVEALMDNLKSEQQEETEADKESETRIIINDFYINSGKVTGKVGFAGVTIPLPKIHLEDLGKDKDSSPLDVLTKIFATLFAVLNSMDLANLAGDVGKTVGDVAGKVGEGFSNLFGGKKDAAEATN